MTATYTVNCSILLTELPLLDRPGAARNAGFEAVEFWWPFDTPTPPVADVTAFIRAIQDAGVPDENVIAGRSILRRRHVRAQGGKKGNSEKKFGRSLHHEAPLRSKKANRRPDGISGNFPVQSSLLFRKASDSGSVA